MGTLAGKNFSEGLRRIVERMRLSSRLETCRSIWGVVAAIPNVGAWHCGWATVNNTTEGHVILRFY